MLEIGWLVDQEVVCFIKLQVAQAKLIHAHTRDIRRAERRPCFNDPLGVI